MRIITKGKHAPDLIRILGVYNSLNCSQFQKIMEHFTDINTLPVADRYLEIYYKVLAI